MFGRPGKYLYLMFLWILILIPGEVVMVKNAHDNYSIYYANKYIIPMVLCCIVAMVLNVVNLTVGFWGGMKYGRKYCVLIGTYAVMSWLAGSITVLLHDYGYVDYVGDAAGSVIMGYLPTIVLYIVGGIPVALFLSYRNRRQQDRNK
jgi:ABC-type branched-subunit amino acid transport system permease subunit